MMSVCSSNCLLVTKYAFLRKELQLVFRDYEPSDHFTMKEFIYKNKNYKSPNMFVLFRNIKNTFGKNVVAFPTTIEATKDLCGFKMIFYEDDLIFSPLLDDKLLLYNEYNILSYISDIEGVVKPIDFHLDYSHVGTREMQELPTGAFLCNNGVRRIVLITENIYSESHCKSPYVTLGKYLGKMSSPTEFDLLNILYKIVIIVEKLHERDIVHLNLNMDTILVNTDTDAIKITNFSYAINLKQICELYTRNPDAIGNRIYLGMPDDIWAIGVIYYMLFYNLPYRRSNISRLMQRLVATRFHLTPENAMQGDVVQSMNAMLNPCREKRPSLKSVRTPLERYINSCIVTENQVVPESVEIAFSSKPKNPNENVAFRLVTRELYNNIELNFQFQPHASDSSGRHPEEIIMREFTPVNTRICLPREPPNIQNAADSSSGRNPADMAGPLRMNQGNADNAPDSPINRKRHSYVDMDTPLILPGSRGFPRMESISLRLIRKPNSSKAKLNVSLQSVIIASNTTDIKYDFMETKVLSFIVDSLYKNEKVIDPKRKYIEAQFAQPSTSNSNSIPDISISFPRTGGPTVSNITIGNPNSTSQNPQGQQAALSDRELEMRNADPFLSVPLSVILERSAAREGNEFSRVLGNRHSAAAAINSPLQQHSFTSSQSSIQFPPSTGRIMGAASNTIRSAAQTTPLSEPSTVSITINPSSTQNVAQQLANFRFGPAVQSYISIPGHSGIPINPEKPFQIHIQTVIKGGEPVVKKDNLNDDAVVPCVLMKDEAPDEPSEPMTYAEKHRIWRRELMQSLREYFIKNYGLFRSTTNSTAFDGYITVDNAVKITQWLCDQFWENRLVRECLKNKEASALCRLLLLLRLFYAKADLTSEGIKIDDGQTYENNLLLAYFFRVCRRYSREHESFFESMIQEPVEIKPQPEKKPVKHGLVNKREPPVKFYK